MQATRSQFKHEYLHHFQLASRIRKHFSCARFGFYALFRIHELIFSGILEGYGIQMKVVLILGSWDLALESTVLEF